MKLTFDQWLEITLEIMEHPDFRKNFSAREMVNFMIFMRFAKENFLSIDNEV